MSSATEFFFKLAGDHADKDPSRVAMDTPLREIVGQMGTQKRSAVIVTDADRRPSGIITEQDIVRRATFSATPDQPASDIMTHPVCTIGCDERLFIAIARMRRLGHRHMPVVDGNGRLTGILDLHEAMVDAASGLVERIDDLTRDDSLDGLREIKAGQVDFAEHLFADSVPAVEVQALLTHVNNDIYRRVVDLNLVKIKEAPPVSFSMIVMGSGGRGENFLYPDQDYGFILSDYPDEKRDEIDLWFTGLARGVSDDLDAIGIPYCKGDVMATNPLWRKSISKWKAQVDDWNARAFSATLLHFDIFFDFRPSWGDNTMPTDLRRHVTEVTRGNAPFLRALFISDRDHGSALRWFGRFATERDDPEHKGKINLKLYGTLPLVEGVRMLALREGVEETGTLARIKALCESGAFKRDEADDLDAAYKTICDLMLRRQIADFKAGLTVSNFLHPKTLRPQERRQLRDAFRAIDRLRTRINFEIGGEVF